MKLLARAQDAVATAAIAAAVLAATAAPASAEAMSVKIKGVVAEMGALALLAAAISFIAGVFITIVAILKFKAHADNANQNGLKEPIIYLVVGALLIGLPVVLGTMTDTLGIGAGVTDGKTAITIKR